MGIGGVMWINVACGKWLCCSDEVPALMIGTCKECNIQAEVFS